MRIVPDITQMMNEITELMIQVDKLQNQVYDLQEENFGPAKFNFRECFNFLGGAANHLRCAKEWNDLGRPGVKNLVKHIQEKFKKEE